MCPMYVVTVALFFKKKPRLITTLIVLQGAQDILNELPVEFVEPLELKDVSESGGLTLFKPVSVS